MVKAGQVLVKMNDVTIKSEAEITHVQYYSSLANRARLLAERDGKAAITYPAELLNARPDPHAVEDINVQNELFSSRRASL